MAWRYWAVAVVAACNFTAPSSPDGHSGEPSRGSDAATLHDAALDAFASHPDASGTCDPTLCGNYAGTCVGGTCTITVTQPNNGQVTCPPGEPCNVVCTVDDSCNDGIDCSQATGCTISCTSAADHCGGGNIQCSPGACTINCDGDHSCSNQRVECSPSSCTSKCQGAHSCGSENLTCQPNTFCTQECCGGLSSCGGITCTGNFGLCFYEPFCF